MCVYVRVPHKHFTIDWIYILYIVLNTLTLKAVSKVWMSRVYNNTNILIACLLYLSHTRLFGDQTRHWNHVRVYDSSWDTKCVHLLISKHGVKPLIIGTFTHSLAPSPLGDSKSKPAAVWRMTIKHWLATNTATKQQHKRWSSVATRSPNATYIETYGIRWGTRAMLN